MSSPIEIKTVTDSDEVSGVESEEEESESESESVESSSSTSEVPSEHPSEDESANSEELLLIEQYKALLAENDNVRVPDYVESDGSAGMQVMNPESDSEVDPAEVDPESDSTPDSPLHSTSESTDDEADPKLKAKKLVKEKRPRKVVPATARKQVNNKYSVFLSTGEHVGDFIKIQDIAEFLELSYSKVYRIWRKQDPLCEQLEIRKIEGLKNKD